MTITTPDRTHNIVTTRTADLLAAIKDANKAVAKRPNVPVLTGVRLHTEAGALHLSRYDYEVAITKRVSAFATDTTIEPTLVVGASLATVLALLDQKADVVLYREGHALIVQQGTKRVELATLPVEDFPALPPAPLPTFLQKYLTTGPVLKQLSDAVAPFLGRDDMLPVLTATHLEFDGDVLSAASTDRFRLAVFTTPVVTTYTGSASSLVPGLPTISGIFAKDELVQLTIDSGGNYAHFESDTTTMVVRTIDGQFPRVRSLFPSDVTTTASFEPLTFLKSLKFVAAGVERNEAVNVVVNAGEPIEISSVGDGVSVTDQVPAQAEGEPVMTGFNPTFLVDAVKVFGKGHDVTMSSTSGTKPSVFTSESIPSLRVLLMPRRLVR